MAQQSTRQIPAIVMLVLAVAIATPLHAQTYSALYEFGSKSGDPVNPQYPGIITQGRDGALYTTTPGGGSLCFFCGTMFKITPSGMLTVVYNFNDTGTPGPGFSPFSGLTLGTDGNFYGTNKVGGTFNVGTVFKINASGTTLTTLYNFGTVKYLTPEGVYPIAPRCKAGTEIFMERRLPRTMEPTLA